MTQQQAEQLMRFADLHDVGMLCFDGEALTVGSFAIDTNLPEDDECRLVIEYDRVHNAAQLRAVLGY